MVHRWHFFRKGGVDQVSLRHGQDLASLATLDQKLWVALAMPVAGVDLDRETLALLDSDGDGRIRVQDLLAAVTWIERTFKSPADVLHSQPEVKLEALADARIVAAARRMLADLGKPQAAAITVDDTIAIAKAFASTALNGDYIVTPASTDDPELRRAIEDAIAVVGSTLDRSGKPGIDQPRADELFAAVDQRAAWLARGREPSLAPLGAATANAAAAYIAVRDKLEDYFTRCRILAFDPRGAATLAAKDEDLAALAARSLTAGDAELAKLPLARPEAAGALRLGAEINPAWSDRMADFVDHVAAPILGRRDSLTASDIATIRERLAGYLAWQDARPATKADALEASRLEDLAKPGIRVRLAGLIQQDGALAAEYDQIASVVKAVRLQRDAGRLLRNFVNFSDFYGDRNGIFQAGTLYLDARAFHLCVPVADPAKHAALAGSSEAYLLYCSITRDGQTRQIAAAVTNGDNDDLFVGRNGVFYDRDGKDWDATITKIVAKPISIREAFWSPYKKLVRVIEDTVTKRAAAADAAATAKVEAAGAQVGHADKAKPAAPEAAPKKLDLGTVAAIGIAVGGIGTLAGALLGAMFGLGVWLPLGIVALLLMISAPAMVLAWLKLRRRNLGPILDANGWAINGRARINVAFGARLTELAALPERSVRSLDDPFADKKPRWKRWVILAVLVVLAIGWWRGMLDPYLPESIRVSEVLGAKA